ncbi:hypothetical protein [uncultured Microbacterium sp.]|uniref:hypothetical protein n=1 Tax=uncultured Microbacterium sp. TaxID=191216 RepID=UPI0025F0BA71|nr:hypothetical protein [uncultured Microbacterium sp.]
MTARPGFPAVTGAATFQDIRRSLSGMVVKSAAGALRTGVLVADTTPLMVGTASMVVNVQTCVVVLDRSGAVFLPNDGVHQVTLSSAPSSGSRWSVIYAKQRETEAPFSDATAGPIIDKVESTTSETAARNLLPAGARELGVWKVDAGVSTTNAASGVTYTETVPYTAMEGGVVLLRNQTEQDAWTPHDGSLAFRVDEGVHLRRAGGKWMPTSGPFIDLIGGTTVNSSGSTNVPIWSAPGSGDSVATANWFSYNSASGDITVLKSGRYEIEARVAIAPVSGATVSMHLIKNGTPSNIIAQDSLSPSPSFGGIAKLSVLSIALTAGETVRVWVPQNGVSGGTVTVGGNGRGLCEFLIRAVG